MCKPLETGSQEDRKVRETRPFPCNGKDIPRRADVFLDSKVLSPSRHPCGTFLENKSNGGITRPHPGLQLMQTELRCIRPYLKTRFTQASKTSVGSYKNQYQSYNKNINFYHMFLTFIIFIRILQRKYLLNDTDTTEHLASEKR